MSKKYDSKQTIETILSVSANLFLEKGFEKTSMQHIADIAGISKGAIYHHFKSKEDIINAVMEKQASNVEQSLNRWLDDMKSLNAKDKLIAILEKNLSDQEAHYLDNVLSTQIKSPEYIVSYMQDCVNKSAPIFSKIIHEGIEDGSITTEFPDECAEVFFLLINIWCDPAIFECSTDKLIMRLKFLQQMMKAMGVDIVSDNMIVKTSKLLRKLYPKENETHES